MTRGLQSLKEERDRLKNQIDQSSTPMVTSSPQSVLESIKEQLDQPGEAIDEHVQSCRSLARKQELLETIPGIGSATAYAGLTPSHHRESEIPQVKRSPAPDHERMLRVEN